MCCRYRDLTTDGLERRAAVGTAEIFKKKQKESLAITISTILSLFTTQIHLIKSVQNIWSNTAGNFLYFQSVM